MQQKTHNGLLVLISFSPMWFISCKNQPEGNQNSQEASTGPVQNSAPNSAASEGQNQGAKETPQSKVTAESNLMAEPPEFRKFEFPPPSPKSVQKQIQIWATYYYVPQVKASPKRLIVWAK